MMKLPFFEPPARTGAAPERVDPPWRAMMLVCAKCKGPRRGPDARGIRKGMKRILGKQKALRVLESECMGVCPDDAITVCTMQAGAGETRVCLVRSEDELEKLAEGLRGVL
ncbi:MAG: hypothetical protein ABW252_10850 [Polyangiales bacterium]